MSGTQQTINGQAQVDQNQAVDIMFRIRCAIPAIVQSYDPGTNTVEAQPAIRERLVMEDGSIQYLNLPLLINVPVVFPTSTSAGITYPVNAGDECLVIFSDLAIDNFWTSGSIQNPIEVRRHDLSDGIAIPCCLSVTKARSSTGTLRMAMGSSVVDLSGSSAKLSVGDKLVEATASGIRMASGQTYVAVNDNGVSMVAGSTSITIREGIMNFSVNGHTFTGEDIYNKLQE